MEDNTKKPRGLLKNRHSDRLKKNQLALFQGIIIIIIIIIIIFISTPYTLVRYKMPTHRNMQIEWHRLYNYLFIGIRYSHDRVLISPR